MKEMELAMDTEVHINLAALCLEYMDVQDSQKLDTFDAMVMAFGVNV